MSSDTASSTKSHRRCNIEVSSVLFASGSSPERTTEQDCAYHNTFPAAIMQQQHSPSSVHLKVKPKSVSTIESTGSKSMGGIHDSVAKRSSGESKNEINILDSAGAIELIRQLSFDSTVPSRPTTPHSEKRSSFRIEPRDGGERPPVSPTSPPLPRKNIRFGFSQIMRNHYRARSTSITDASESHLSESALDTEEMSMTSLSHSTTSSEDNEDNEESSRKAFDMKPLIAIEYNVSSTQKLAPRPSPLLGHVRSRSMCSESSYISSSSDEEDDFYGGGPDHYLLEEDLD